MDISEFDRVANDQFVSGTLLLLGVIGISVFSVQEEHFVSGKQNFEVKPKAKRMDRRDGNGRNWNPAIKDFEFFFQTKNGGKAKMKWIGENEFVLCESSILSRTFANNKTRLSARKLRNDNAESIRELKVIKDIDIVFASVNTTSKIVLGGSTNVWVSWKTNKNETLDSVIKRLNQFV